MDDSQQNSMPSKKTSSSEEFDNQFMAIPSLRLKPWVGKDYINSKGNRLLIIGESQYCYESQDKSHKEILDNISQIGWTRTVIHSKGLYAKIEEKFILGRNIEKLIFNSPTISKKCRQKFWNSVCFYNFVQRPLSSIKERPNKNDWQEGWVTFFQVIAVLQPDYILFCGMEALNSTPSFKETVTKNGFNCNKGIRIKTEETKIGNIYPRTKGIISGYHHHQIILTSVGHPSRCFSWEWSKLIHRQIPDYIAWLKQMQ